MKIFVVGNINAGKSFLIKKLVSIFPLYKILAIDEFRKSFGDGTLEKEMEIRKLFAKAILQEEDAIIEYSGGTTITHLFIDNLDANSFIVIEVSTDVETCLERIQYKDFSKIPYPKFDETLDNTIKRLDQEFKNGAISVAFKNKYLKKFLVDSHDDMNEFPFLQYELAFKIRSLFNDGQHCLVAFGSLGRGDMSKESDIDLFLLTQRKVNEVLKQLKTCFPNDVEWIVQKDFIAGYYGDQLIEVKVVKRIEDMQLFYVKSEIKERNKTILLGDVAFEKKLSENVDSYKEDFAGEFEYTLARLTYYVKSLERVRLKQDEYKFFFHNNIVIHEYVRVCYFLHNRRSFAYLPKNALQYVDENTLKSMVFNLGDNMNDHKAIIIQITEDILPKAREYLSTLKNTPNERKEK